MRSRMRVLVAVVIVLSVAAGQALGQARSGGQAEAAPAAAAVNSAATPVQPAAGPAVPAAQPAAPLRRPPRVYYTRTQPSVPTLLIPSAGLKPDQLAAIHEDMQIMSRILDKALGGGDRATYVYSEGKVDPTTGDPFSIPAYSSAAATFRTLLAGPAKCMEAIYLEGFGALFVTRVDFPLAPVKTGVAPPAQPKESVWEQTKQELHGGNRASQAMRATAYGQYYGSGSRAQEYDADKVGQLQKTLLETFEHASNIRHLKPEDSIAVAVLGSEVKGPVEVQYILLPEAGKTPLRSRSTSRAITTRPTALTIRLKKSDVDAFAKDELSFDELREKATILAY